MSANLADRYRRWFEYEKDSHAKVFASLETVPVPSRTSAPYQKALDLMAHIATGRYMWLHRFGVAKEAPKDLFPSGVSLSEVAEQLQKVEQAWSEYLSRVDEAELARTFEYQSLEGPCYRDTVEDILTQLLGHSWYHRGQIAMLVRSAGGEPAATDFVFWTRELCPPM